MASYFVIYSENDKEKVEDLTTGLTRGINNVTLKSFNKDQDQINELTKKSIIDCDFFVCCLSKNSSQLLLNIAKFARCIARKEVWAYFIPNCDQKEFLKDEELRFFDQKSNIFESIENIKEVKIFLMHSLIFTFTQITGLYFYRLNQKLQKEN